MCLFMITFFMVDHLHLLLGVMFGLMDHLHSKNRSVSNHYHVITEILVCGPNSLLPLGCFSYLDLLFIHFLILLTSRSS